jgi:hypothetical protein
MSKKSKKAENEKPVHNKKLIYVAVALASILILTSMTLYIFSRQPSQPKAAIIDQLSSSQLIGDARCPNQTFVETAKSLLSQRFSEVDYYSDNATVDQYRLLASLGYKLIIWRAHSALALESNFIAISTSERNSPQNHDRYLTYLNSVQLILGNVSDSVNYYLEITPKFIVECMNGRFEDTVIVLMSCNGLKSGYYQTAETFIQKGVKAFISWDRWIGSSDNDDGITILLQRLITENKTISTAVDGISYDSSFGPCNLHYYPDTSEVSNYTIPDYRQNNLAANTMFAAMPSLKKKFET